MIRYRITGIHKKTLVEEEFFFSSIKECAFYNKAFKDFVMHEEVKNEVVNRYN